MEQSISDGVKVHDQLTLYFENNAHVEIFMEAFLPETNRKTMKRSTMEITAHYGLKPHIKVEIRAQDLIAFRATINSVIVSADTVQRTLALVDKNRKI